MLRPFALTSLILLTFSACSSDDDADTPSNTGGASASGGSGSGGETTGGAPSTGGVGNGPGSGGVSTGGLATSGGTGGAPETGGSNAGGTGSAGSTGGSPGSGGGGSANCSVCDDFESTAVNMPPDPTKWSTVLGYSLMGDPANVVVDDAEAHSGAQSVKITGAGEVWGFSPIAPQDTFFMRAWMKVPAVTATPAIIGVNESADQNGNEARLRLFPNGADGKTYFAGNDKNDNGLYPDALNGSGCSDCTEVPADWFCVEMHFDSSAPSMTVWIDGTEAVTVPSSAGWAWPTSVGFVRLGVLALGGSGPTIWVDDVAFGDQRLGCE